MLPPYKNQSLPDPHTEVWRYLSLDAVIKTVRDRQLRFTRIDKFWEKDPFEGSVPKQQIDDQLLLFAGHSQMRRGAMSLPEHWGEMTRLRRAKARSTHAWAAGDESEALWRLYCCHGLGVALRTTLAQLEKSVARQERDLYVSVEMFDKAKRTALNKPEPSADAGEWRAALAALLAGEKVEEI